MERGCNRMGMRGRLSEDEAGEKARPRGVVEEQGMMGKGKEWGDGRIIQLLFLCDH